MSDIYTDLSAETRFSLFEEQAKAFYAVPTWRQNFCAEFGFAPQTVTKWRQNGPPLHAYRAMCYANEAKSAAVFRARLAKFLADD